MCCLKKMLAAVCAMLCCLACLAVPFLAGAVESKWVEVTDEPLPDASSDDLPEAPYPGWIDCPMNGARFYLVEAARETMVYAAVSESPDDVWPESSTVTGYTPFVTVQAGDPMMMCYHPDYCGFGNDEWICVVLKPESSSYFRRGYVRAADLEQNEDGSIARKKRASQNISEFDTTWAEDGPVLIYAGEKGGEVIGTLREGIVLPSVWHPESQIAYGSTGGVETYDGVGYLYDSVRGMTITVDYEGEIEEEIVDIEEDEGDVGEGTAEQPLL